MIASVYPGRYSENDSDIEDSPGGVAIWDLDTGEMLSLTYLENNRGLNPPWENLPDPLVYVRNMPREGMVRLEVYDRIGGEQLAWHSFQDIFGVMPSQLHATPIPGIDEVAMSIDGSVVVFDPVTAEIKTKSYIGDIGLSEVVISSKPPNLTNN